MSTMLGGFSEEQKANSEDKELCKKIKNDVSKQLDGVNFETFEALSFIKQAVAGIIYIIKILIGGDRCIHVKVFVPLSFRNEDPVVEGIQDGKNTKEKIAVF